MTETEEIRFVTRINDQNEIGEVIDRRGRQLRVRWTYGKKSWHEIMSDDPMDRHGFMVVKCDPPRPWSYDQTPGGMESVRWYLDQWRQAKKLLADGKKVPIRGRLMNEAEFRRYMSKARDERITAKVLQPRWRKLDPDYQAKLDRDARRVYDHRERRIVIRSFETDDFQRQLGHLITPYEERDL